MLVIILLWAGKFSVLRNNNLAEWNRKFQSDQSCKPKRTTFTGDPKYFHTTEPKKTISFNLNKNFQKCWLNGLCTWYSITNPVFWLADILILATCQLIPCKQRLHFRCVSQCAKSSLCRQPFKLIQKSGRINLKTGFFLFLTRLEHCVSLALVLCSRSELVIFFYSLKTRTIWRHTWRLILLVNRKINFAHAQ